MLTRRRSFDVNMANLRYKMRNLEKNVRGAPGSRENVGAWRTLDVPTEGGSFDVEEDTHCEPPSHRKNGVVDACANPELLALNDWPSVSGPADRSLPHPPLVPAIVVDDFGELPSAQRRGSTEDSEKTPLIQGDSLKEEPHQGPSTQHLANQHRCRKRESLGSLLDFKNVKNVFHFGGPTRSHSGDFITKVAAYTDIDLENGNLGHHQGVCESCSKNCLLPDKNKTMSQPSMLHLENEKHDLNANRSKRRASVQFALPHTQVPTVHVPALSGLADGGQSSVAAAAAAAEPGQHRGSICSSIPERGSDATGRSDSMAAAGQQDCRVHCNPRRARARSTTSTGTCVSVPSANDGPSVTYLQNRRTSRTFTVINYGGHTAAAGGGRESRRASLAAPVGDLSPDDVITEAYDDNASMCGSIVSSASRLQQVMALRHLHDGLNNHDSHGVVAATVERDDSERDTLSTQVAELEKQMDYRRKSLRTCTVRSLPQVARRGALFGRRRKHRLVNKQGDFNIQFKNISNRHQRYLADVFTTLLDMQWRYNFLLFIIAFVVSWIGFALIWWLIAHLHGDTNPDDSPETVINGTVPCVVGVKDFTSALLFSIETQHTIGYGVRSMTTACSDAIIVLMIQSIFGVVIQCVMAGVFLAKLARPKRRGETIMFSHDAVICQEDGQYCLIFRVGDMRRSQLVGAMLHAMFVTKRTTQEGDEIPFYQCHLEVTAESEDHDQFIFLSWPIRIVHRITPTSPMWNMCADGLLAEDFEIIVVLEGVVEATGMCMQVRTSYLPSEIKWGNRLAPLHAVCNSTDGRYEIDYAQFHQTVAVEMPDYCAQDAHSLKHGGDDGVGGGTGGGIGGGGSGALLPNMPTPRRRLMSMTENCFGSTYGSPLGLGV